MQVRASGGRHGQHDEPRTTDDAVRDAQQLRARRALRARWRTASLAAGWRFPNDWSLPEVDTVCAAALGGGLEAGTGADSALAELGSARAQAGAGLAETLTDIAALHAVATQPNVEDGFVVPDIDAIPARLLRLTAIGWSDVATAQAAGAEVTDPLTGLCTSAYLGTRLAEVYRQADREGREPAEGHALLAVSLDLSATTGWPRLTGMIVLAAALRAVFDGGESVATVGPSTVAALVARDRQIAERAVALRRELTERIAVDAQLRELSPPKITMIRLPATFEETAEMLAGLRRR